jgi:predicted Zn-dependent protease with MMP-like domain
MRISPERFEELAFEEANQVLAQLPPDLRAEAETVMLEIEARAEDDRLLLGLYEGVPLVERHIDSTPLQPDRITLFHETLQTMARTETELRRQIRKTLIHELGHFFGFDEPELQRRGWG